MNLKKYVSFALNAFLDLAGYTKNKIIYKFPKVLSIEQTLDKIIETKTSFARYGDGEFNLMSNIEIGFQNSTDELAKRLKQVLNSNSNNCLICIPGSLDKLSGMVWRSRLMWMHLISKFYKNYEMHFNYAKVYPNSLITRPYMDLSDKKRSVEIFMKLKRIWQDREILIVEGEYTKLGVGNDLFINAKSVKRIVTANKNVFSKYHDILTEVKTYDKNYLILIALGPTATVLAYDLSQVGFQACDVGHIDVEYEWFLKQTQKKTKISGKFVNEVSTEKPLTEVKDDFYESQILKRIL